MTPLGTGFDATANQSTRDRRLEIGLATVLALHALLRNARVHDQANAVFAGPLGRLRTGIGELIATDGRFELQLGSDGIYVNRQAIRLDAISSALGSLVRSGLRARGIHGMSCTSIPEEPELRELVRLFTVSAPDAIGPRGDPTAPFTALELSLADAGTAATHVRSHDTRLVDAYAHAVFFVSRTIAQLRDGGQPLPAWAASRIVQDLVDLNAKAPARFLHLARCKAGAGAYYGYHGANVAVLAVGFGARLGLGRNRQHDLGMASLFHDIGIAAIPLSFLNRDDRLAEREMAAMQVTPLFAARAILRDRDIHPAALERARAAYDAHSDLRGSRAETGRRIGSPGQIIGICEAFDALTTTRHNRRALEVLEAHRLLRTDLAHRFDESLREKFFAYTEPLAG